VSVSRARRRLAPLLRIAAALRLVAFGWATMLLWVAAEVSAQAPPPGAGLPILREREELPTLEEPEVERPSLELPPLAPPPEAPPFEGEGVVARGFRIVGSTVFSDRELAETVAPFIDRVIVAETLPRITDGLTRLYVDRGYISSGAIVPDQTIEDGIIEIHIIEGGVEAIEIAPGGRLRRSWIEPRVRPGLDAPLNIDALERSLRLLQRDPRVARVDAVLTPASERGQSILRLDVVEAVPWQMDLRAANDLSPAIGGRRGEAIVAHRNVLGFGDSFRASVSGARGLVDVELDYILPVSPWLTDLELSTDISRSEIVEGDFSDLNFRNDLETYGLGLWQPLVHSLENDLSLGAFFERRRSKVEIGDSTLRLETAPGEGSTVKLSLLRVYGEWVNRQPNQVIAARVRGTIGLDLFDATTPNDKPPSSGSLGPEPAYPDAEFTSWLLQGQYARRLPTFLGDVELLARADLQLASGALFSIEAFAIGGATTVRGYHENEIVADNGALASLEIRLPILPPNLRPHELRFAPFVDYGRVWDDGDPNQSRFDRTLVSVGLGLLYRYRDRFDVSAYWGKPLQNDSSREGDEIQDQGFHLEAVLSIF
jgi:hemolysin activation/secretion protein